MGYCSYESGKVRQIFKKIHKIYQISLITYIGLSVFLASLLLANFAFNPRYAPYVYSLIDPSIEIPWLKYISFTVQFVSSMQGYFYINQFEMLAMGFVSSVVLSIDFLTSSSKEIVTEKNQKYAAELILFKYEKLLLLVQQFDSIFSQFLFIYKSTTVIITCCCLYFPFRYFANITASSSSYIFFGQSFSLLFKPSILVFAMGYAHSESITFLQTFKTEILPSLNPSYSREVKKRLQRCQPIGFNSGPYIIVSATVLTYLSVTTTYLIFALQL